MKHYIVIEVESSERTNPVYWGWDEILYRMAQYFPKDYTFKPHKTFSDDGKVGTEFFNYKGDPINGWDKD